MVREQVIQKKIIDFLTKKGFLAFVYTASGYYAKAGLPDIMACSPQGKFIGIEVKKPGEKPRPIQLAYIDAFNKNNGVAFWATSVEEVETTLKERGII